MQFNPKQHPTASDYDAAAPRVDSSNTGATSHHHAHTTTHQDRFQNPTVQETAPPTWVDAGSVKTDNGLEWPYAKALLPSIKQAEQLNESERQAVVGLLGGTVQLEKGARSQIDSERPAPIDRVALVREVTQKFQAAGFKVNAVHLTGGGVNAVKEQAGTVDTDIVVHVEGGSLRQAHARMLMSSALEGFADIPDIHNYYGFSHLFDKKTRTAKAIGQFGLNNLDITVTTGKPDYVLASKARRIDLTDYILNDRTDKLTLIYLLDKARVDRSIAADLIDFGDAPRTWDRIGRCCKDLAKGQTYDNHQHAVEMYQDLVRQLDSTRLGYNKYQEVVCLRKLASMSFKEILHGLLDVESKAHDINRSLNDSERAAFTKIREALVSSLIDRAQCVAALRPMADTLMTNGITDLTHGLPKLLLLEALCQQPESAWQTAYESAKKDASLALSYGDEPVYLPDQCRINDVYKQIEHWLNQSAEELLEYADLLQLNNASAYLKARCEAFDAPKIPKLTASTAAMPPRSFSSAPAEVGSVSAQLSELKISEPLKQSPIAAKSPAPHEQIRTKNDAKVSAPVDQWRVFGLAYPILNLKKKTQFDAANIPSKAITIAWQGVPLTLNGLRLNTNEVDAQGSQKLTGRAQLEITQGALRFELKTAVTITPEHGITIDFEKTDLTINNSHYQGPVGVVYKGEQIKSIYPMGEGQWLSDKGAKRSWLTATFHRGGLMQVKQWPDQLNLTGEMLIKPKGSGYELVPTEADAFDCNNPSSLTKKFFHLLLYSKLSR